MVEVFFTGFTKGVAVGVLGFVSFNDKDDNGDCCLCARASSLLVSMNMNVEALGGRFRGCKLHFRSIRRVLVARSRTSRMGSIKDLDASCRLPMCTAHGIRTNVRHGCYIQGGVIPGRTRVVRGNIPFLINRFEIAPFKIPRSDASGINCFIRRRNIAFYLVASIKRVARRVRRFVNGTGCLILRSGCDIRVLRAKGCPRCLGSEVLKPGNRLDGSRYTRTLTSFTAPDLHRI